MNTFLRGIFLSGAASLGDTAATTVSLHIATAGSAQARRTSQHEQQRTPELPPADTVQDEVNRMVDVVHVDSERPAQGDHGLPPVEDLPPERVALVNQVHDLQRGDTDEIGDTDAEQHGRHGADLLLISTLGCGQGLAVYALVDELADDEAVADEE